MKNVPKFLAEIFGSKGYFGTQMNRPLVSNKVSEIRLEATMQQTFFQLKRNFENHRLQGCLTLARESNVTLVPHFTLIRTNTLTKRAPITLTLLERKYVMICFTVNPSTV